MNTGLEALAEENTEIKKNFIFYFKGLEYMENYEIVLGEIKYG